MIWRLGRLGTVMAVLGIAITMLAVGAAFTHSEPRQTANTPPSAQGAASNIAAGAANGDVDSAIAALQKDLRRVPGDYPGWAALGIAYVQQARVSGGAGLLPASRRSPSAVDGHPSP